MTTYLLVKNFPGLGCGWYVHGHEVDGYVLHMDSDYVEDYDTSNKVYNIPLEYLLKVEGNNKDIANDIRVGKKVFVVNVLGNSPKITSGFIEKVEYDEYRSKYFKMNDENYYFGDYGLTDRDSFHRVFLDEESAKRYADKMQELMKR